MDPDTPPLNKTPPLDLGCTKGVEQRIRRSRAAVRAAKDFAPAFHEALRRKLAGRGRGDEVGPYDETQLDLLSGTGSDIEELGAEMAAADHALARAREQLNELRKQRDSVRQRTYKKLSDYRKWVREVLSDEDLEKVTLRFDGETERSPSPLARQANLVIAWATNEEDPPPAPRDEDAVKVEWPKTVRTLERLRHELDTAVDEVALADAALSQPLERRTRAIQAFDKEYPRCARTLETGFEVVGLPTLATFVRPHLKGTGRVGRPSKRPPKDEHPDLVDAALAVRRARRRAWLASAAAIAVAEDPPAEEAPPAPKPRRRVVHRPFVARPFRFGPPKEPAAPRRRKAGRRPEPAPRPRRRRRRRVWVAWTEDGATPLRLVQQPKPQDRDLPGRARPAPWTTRALAWWQGHREAR